MEDSTEKPKPEPEQPQQKEELSKYISGESEHRPAEPMRTTGEPDWYIFRGSGDSDRSEKELKLPPPPPWRDFNQSRSHKGRTFQVKDEQVQLVNAAFYLRRPLLVTGPPGTGKSSLAYAVAVELGLGEVLLWPITSRSKLKDGLYNYDAIGRLQATNTGGPQGGNDAEPPPISQFIRLGPLGTALADSRINKPRVLLIDEIDKSDIDLPNDLLNVFEDGEFEIPELSRLAQLTKEKVEADEQTDSVTGRRLSTRMDKPRDSRGTDTIEIVEGKVKCEEFPFVILTSNAERELPPPFLRRCRRLEIQPPDEKDLKKIVRAHFNELAGEQPLPEPVVKYIGQVVKRRKEKQEYVATDQLLNAVHLILNKKVGSSLEEDLRVRKLLEDFIMETISTSLS